MQPTKRGVLVGLCLMLVGPVHAQEKGTAAQNCIESNRINSWRVVSDRQIDVVMGANRHYRLSLSLAAETAALRSISQIGFKPRSDGRLCAGTGFVIADGRLIRVESIDLLPSP
ncbi:DUF6491 family protein [Niveispirillum irakense]|uniref:DUF6491 family protein n=1 Tax=Niveispirillum irakense TaxID=34011 RepID=UPI0012B60D7C|nr:DUF6491 family protein [Niveispirillum irakense]